MTTDHPAEEPPGDEDATAEADLDLAPRFQDYRGVEHQKPAAELVVGFRGTGSDEEKHNSIAALTTAADLGRRLDARLHVVHVVDLSDYPIDPDASDWEQQARDTLAEEYATIQDTLGIGVAWTYNAAHGSPAELLRRVADEWDALMFVVGSRGEGIATLLSRLATPSVTHRLISRTHRPVLVVPPHSDGDHHDQ